MNMKLTENTEKPIHFISLGAGVQSSTMALMSEQGEFPHKPDFAVFADTMAEPKVVYDWLDWLEKQLSYPVYRVSKGDLYEKATKLFTSKKETKYAQSAVPAFIVDRSGKKGIMMRQCTTDYKITPINSFVRKLIGKKVKAVQWLGISLDEVVRMRDAREPWKTNYYPLIDRAMTRNDCLKWMEKNEYPKPPRSSCVFCPFHSNREWLELQRDEPQEFERAVQFEKDYQLTYQSVNNFRGIPYLHNSFVPLSEVVFEDKSQVNLFNNECEGHCGV
jgi:hypothetical protein